MIESSKKMNTITFEFKISKNYATYRVSGGHGGLTPQGEIMLNLYHERAAIPKTQTFELTSNGLGPEPLSEDRKTALIRDVMVGLSMDAGVARSLAKWLNEKADIYDKMLGENASMASREVQ